MLYEAMYYKNYNDKVKCFLCPHNCVISNGKYGICNVRKNEEGILKTINYGEITSMAVDPIEKKPLYHFKPTKSILSVGTFGCNFSCSFCQNYSIAHHKPKSEYISPEPLIDTLLNLKDNIGIAFTYNEPSIWYEYIYDTAKKLKQNYPELNIVLVTNGFIEEQPLLELLPYIDAMNIDLKSFSQDYYKRVCGGGLEDVMKTIETAHDKCHVEITTLLVNDLNDSKEEVEKISSFLGSLDNNIPLHLSRYFPTYKMNRPPTEVESLLVGREVAKQHLNYVYIGNVSGIDNSTYCPKCENLLVERNVYKSEKHINNPICPECGFEIKMIL
ncbi:AmmeMemoRadiSam system radical SAM enzyme [Mycoplasmatota bacterium WC44]